MSYETGDLAWTELVSQIIVEHENDFISNLLLYSGLALMIWDTICTLGDEVETVWKAKFNLGVLFYLFTRYGSLLFIILSLFPSSPLHLKSCIVSQVFASWTMIFTTIGFYGLLTLRTYAIASRRTLALILFLALDFGRFLNQSISFITVVLFCVRPTESLVDQANQESIASKVLNFSSLGLALIITVRTTYSSWYFFRHNKMTTEKALSVVLFEQGLMSFGILILVPVVTESLAAIFPARAPAVRAAVPFTFVAPTLVICRFYLSLRRRNLGRTKTRQTIQISGVSTAMGFYASSLPSSRFSNMHQEILSEFGNRNETVIIAAEVLTESPLSGLGEFPAKMTRDDDMEAQRKTMTD